jgi:hypothetical protein
MDARFRLSPANDEEKRKSNKYKTNQKVMNRYAAPHKGKKGQSTEWAVEKKFA